MSAELKKEIQTEGSARRVKSVGERDHTVGCISVAAVLLFAACIWLLANDVTTVRKTVDNPSEIGWGGEVVAEMNPTGALFTERWDRSSREDRTLTVSGHSDLDSLTRFTKTHCKGESLAMTFPLESDEADWWNKIVAETGNERVKFQRNDIGFNGTAHLANHKPVHVRGAFSESTGAFLLQIRRINPPTKH